MSDDPSSTYNRLLNFIQNDTSDNWWSGEMEISELSDNELFSPWMNDFQEQYLPLSNEKVYKNILSEEGKKQLTYLTYNSENETQKNCPIEQEPFIPHEVIVKLPCLHIFKKESILKWLSNEQAICPLCRYKMPSVEVKKEENEQTPAVMNTFFFDIEDIDFQLALENSLYDSSDNVIHNIHFIESYSPRSASPSPPPTPEPPFLPAPPSNLLSLPPLLALPPPLLPPPPPSSPIMVTPSETSSLPPPSPILLPLTAAERASIPEAPPQI
jgi:hypothetical protein